MKRIQDWNGKDVFANMVFAIVFLVVFLVQMAQFIPVIVLAVCVVFFPESPFTAAYRSWLFGIGIILLAFSFPLTYVFGGWFLARHK